MKCGFSIAIEEKYATFECYGCFVLEMTPDGLTYNEVHAQWVMFKRKHKDCKRKTPD